MNVPDAARPYRSLFCGFYLPRHPGYSGGEIRDYHLLRHLLQISRVEFFAFHGEAPRDHERPDVLGPLLDGRYTPETLSAAEVDHAAFRLNKAQRLTAQAHARGLPVIGPRHHWDAASRLPNARGYSLPHIQRRLREARPDFLFVSPQLNPIALTLGRGPMETRLVMASYDVEAVRVSRLAALGRGLPGLAQRLEARRAARFERDNLARFDGVIAVSDLDRGIFMERYGLPAERVLTLENGVDPGYFAFQPRPEDGPPAVVFVGSLGYPPNAQAAWRLMDGIMPLVRKRWPDARLHLVGQSPEQALQDRHAPPGDVVTGLVDDVRPWLAGAAVCCIPLAAGSGTKYKVLEALSAGVPVVCTRLALEGLDLRDGEHVRVADSDPEIAAAVVRVLGDPVAAQEHARRARREVEERHSWDAVLPRLDPWLAALRRLPVRPSR
jgi:glycosyltransferase involved in cell wall biosynthesis